MTTMPTISRDAAEAIKAAVRLGLESLRAEPPQRLGDWAQEHFKLAGESSHQKGAWIAWGFQVGIMDFMSDDRIVSTHAPARGATRTAGGERSTSGSFNPRARTGRDAKPLCACPRQA